MANNGIFGISWWRGRLSKLQNKLDEIDQAWQDRGVADATTEPEWAEYERTLYAMVEVEEVIECLVFG